MALPGHGEARKLAVSPLADVRVLHPCSRVNWPSLLDNDGRRAPHEQDQLLQERQPHRSEEHTSELQSLMRISYAVFCLKKKKNNITPQTNTHVKTKRNTQYT